MGHKPLCNQLRVVVPNVAKTLLENDFYLVHFKTEIDVAYALIQGP